MRGVAWLFVALGFLAVGADAYWSWKAHDWAYRPIAFYLDLANPDWLTAFRAELAGWSEKTARFAARVLTWPVWGPAFAIGFLLALLTRPPLERRSR